MNLILHFSLCLAGMAAHPHVGEGAQADRRIEYLTGRVTDVDGEPIATGEARMMFLRGKDPVEAPLRKDGSYGLSVPPGSERGESPRSLAVEAAGFVSKEIFLDERESRQGLVRLDVQLETGFTRAVELRGSDGSAIQGAKIELVQAGHDALRHRAPAFSYVQTTNGEGVATFEDQPPTGLRTAIIHLPGLDDWARRPLDLGARKTVLVVASPSRLTVDVRSLGLQGLEPGAVILSAGYGHLAGGLPGRNRGVLGEEGKYWFEGLRAGLPLWLRLNSKDGAYWDFTDLVPMTSTVTERVVDCAASTPARAMVDPRRRSMSGRSLRWRLVDTDGASITWQQLRGFFPDRIHVRWGDGLFDRMGRSWLGQMSPGMSVNGEMDYPNPPPEGLRIAGEGFSEALDFDPASANPVITLKVDLSEFLGETHDVMLRGKHLDGSTASGGWAIVLTHRDSARNYHASAGFLDPSGTIRLGLPIGDYGYRAWSGSDVTTGRLTVDGEGPLRAEILFPGQGVLVGQVVSDARVFAVHLDRRASTIPKEGSVASNVLPDGRFWLLDAIAGESTLVARALTPRGVVVFHALADVAIAPNVINRLEPIKIEAASLTGPRLTCRENFLGGRVEIRQAGALVFSGWLAAGESALVPSRAPLDVIVFGRDAYARSFKRLRVNFPADGDVASM